MSIKHLEKLFNPQVIAVAGQPAETPAQDPVFRRLQENLQRTSRTRTIYIITPGKPPREEEGFSYRPDLEGITKSIDLLFLLCPLQQLPDYFQPEILEKTAVIAILRNIVSPCDREILLQAAAAARYHQTGIIGVNSCGILRPPIQLNLSPHPQSPRAGKLAFFSQSGAVIGTVLNLAAELDIGFSHIAGIGSLLDIKFGELIDYIGDDPEVEAILLYVENLRDVRRFISACRSVSRIKPIIAIKAGRHPRIHEVLKRRVFSRIGAGPVYDSVFRRAGIISVDNFTELLTAGRTLAKRNIPAGDRLGIITNSGGLAIFATDKLLFNQIELTPLPCELLTRLRQILPHHLIQNPLDVGGTSPTRTFIAVIEACLASEHFDALLILAAAHSELDPRKLIRQTEKLRRGRNCVITYAWLNASRRQRRTAAAAFAHQGIDVYFNLPAALAAYLYSRRYHHKLKQLTALTPRFQRQFHIEHLQKRDFLKPFATQEPQPLPDTVTNRLLRPYGLQPVSRQLTPYSPPLELVIGSRVDVEFGPYLYLGLAGLAAEIEPGHSIMLPPLNPFLAQLMIEHSPAAGALRKRPAALKEDLAITLLRLASLVTDVPEIADLKLQLQENGKSFTIQQATITTRTSHLKPPRHLVITPYPNEYEFHDRLGDGREILVRPIRPEDEALHYELFLSFSRQTNYFRFFSYRRLTIEQAARFTQIDYDREMAIIALLEEAGRQRSIGVNRLTYQPRLDKHEFAIVVGDPWQGLGVGRILMRRLLGIASDRHIKRIYGTVLAENQRMIRFCLDFGFVLETQEGNTLTFRLELE